MLLPYKNNFALYSLSFLKKINSWVAAKMIDCNPKTSIFDLLPGKIVNICKVLTANSFHFVRYP
jgi:hypothetical protein